MKQFLRDIAPALLGLAIVTLLAAVWITLTIPTQTADHAPCCRFAEDAQQTLR
jgi:hypothetical protein